MLLTQLAPTPLPSVSQLPSSLPLRLTRSYFFSPHPFPSCSLSSPHFLPIFLHLLLFKKLLLVFIFSPFLPLSPDPDLSQFLHFECSKDEKVSAYLSHSNFLFSVFSHFCFLSQSRLFLACTALMLSCALTCPASSPTFRSPSPFLPDALSLHCTIRLSLTPLLSCLQWSLVTSAFLSIACSPSPAVRCIQLLLSEQYHLPIHTSNIKMSAHAHFHEQHN